MNLATYLTLFRIFVSPLFLLLYMQHETLGISAELLPYVLLTLLCTTELSDAFDGYLARRMGQVTDLGKLLDPMADSIARISVFLTFTQPPVSIPLLLVFVFLYRDSVISTLRTLCALRGVTLAARPSGKLKAVIQATVSFTIVTLMIPYSMGAISIETLQEASFWLVASAAIYAAASGVEYLIANRQYIPLSVQGSLRRL